MVTRHQRGGVTWVDLESPTREEVASVMGEFGVDGRIEEDVHTPTAYPLVAFASSYVYLVLHFPTTDPYGGTRTQEIDFVAGKDFLITVRYEVISTIHTLHRVLEAEALLGTRTRNATPADILERLLRQLYGEAIEQIETVARSLERMEEDIFSGRERETVRSLSLAARRLLRFDIALGRHQEPLSEFLSELATAKFFGGSFHAAADRIEAERAHAASAVNAYQEVLGDLRITNDSLLSSSQNEVMKRLTIMTFIAVPLTVIAGVFGMNVDDMPIVNSAYGFWAVLGIMAVAVALLFLYFRKKRWL